MTVFDKLKQRLKTDLNLDTENFERLYPGHWQRSAGAWLWSCRIAGTTIEIGSCSTAKSILAAKKIDIIGDEVYCDNFREAKR